MVKNKGKGGKNRRRGKADGDMKRELVFKEDGQGAHAPTLAHPTPNQAHRVPLPSAEYGQVTRMLGNGRLEAFCFDGVNRLCHIRGKLRKRVWIGVVRARTLGPASPAGFPLPPANPGFVLDPGPRDPRRAT